MSALSMFLGTAAQMRRAYAIADAAVVSLIESGCHRTQRTDGAWWYDTRELTEPQVWGPELAQDNAEHLAYGHERGLLVATPDEGWEGWVRIDVDRPSHPPTPAVVRPPAPQLPTAEGLH